MAHNSETENAPKKAEQSWQLSPLHSVQCSDNSPNTELSKVPNVRCQDVSDRQRPNSCLSLKMHESLGRIETGCKNQTAHEGAYLYCP